MTSTALCVVATADHYQDFARELFLTADLFFHPTPQREFLLVDGETGWPRATMCRHELLLRNLPDTDYVFLCDADMRFEEFVGVEVLPENYGITAALHPGYVGKPYRELPYDPDPESACHVPVGEGGVYYAGGFFGGSRRAMRTLLAQTALCMELDMRRGHVPVWHDESALNRVLATHPPETVLSPAYVHPDRDGFYIEQVWGGTGYPRRLVALDKTACERSGR